MKIAFPNNIFAKLLQQALPDDLKNAVIFQRASEISSELEKGKFDLALIPSCDLIKHPHFYISKKYAVSFDGALSNVFIYFEPNQVKFQDLYFTGDISTNEVVLSKILFQERYSEEIKIHLTENYETGKNYLVAGNDNFKNEKYKDGLSFSDELSTMLFLPYVNFIIASRDDNFITIFNEALNNIDNLLEENLDNMLNSSNLPSGASEFIKENYDSVYFEMTETEIEGLTELIRLPYYHGIVDEMIDLKLE